MDLSRWNYSPEVATWTRCTSCVAGENLVPEQTHEMAQQQRARAAVGGRQSWRHAARQRQSASGPQRCAATHRKRRGISKQRRGISRRHRHRPAHAQRRLRRPVRGRHRLWRHRRRRQAPLRQGRRAPVGRLARPRRNDSRHLNFIYQSSGNCSTHFPKKFAKRLAVYRVAQNKWHNFLCTP